MFSLGVVYRPTLLATAGSLLSRRAHHGRMAGYSEVGDFTAHEMTHIIDLLRRKDRRSPVFTSMRHPCWYIGGRWTGPPVTSNHKLVGDMTRKPHILHLAKKGSYRPATAYCSMEGGQDMRGGVDHPNVVGTCRGELPLVLWRLHSVRSSSSCYWFADGRCYYNPRCRLPLQICCRSSRSFRQCPTHHTDRRRDSLACRLQSSSVQTQAPLDL